MATFPSITPQYATQETKNLEFENAQKYKLILSTLEEHQEFSDLFNLIPVGENDANKLACNSFVINESVIFPSDDIDIIETVADLGCNIEISNVSEFLKSGGACQCLAITLQ